jgi:AcrR family transcriptional regulator
MAANGYGRAAERLYRRAIRPLVGQDGSSSVPIDAHAAAKIIKPSSNYHNDMSEKRNQILSAATRLFGLYGYHSVGVDWIISEARVTKTTMYRHFPLKTDLIVEVLEQRARACAVSLEAAIAPAASPLERLEKLFEWHHEWFNMEEFSGCMFAHAAAEFPAKGYPIHAAAASQKAGLIQRIEDILSEMMGQRDAATLAPILMMLLDGATVSAQICGRTNAATEAWTVAREMVLARMARHAVTPSPAEPVQGS